MTKTIFASEVKTDKAFIIKGQIEELAELNDVEQYNQLIGYLTATYDLHLFSVEETQQFEQDAMNAMNYGKLEYSITTGKTIIFI